MIKRKNFILILFERSIYILNYGWAGTVEQFIQLDLQSFIVQLQNHVYKNLKVNDRKTEVQTKAWIDSYK